MDEKQYFGTDKPENTVSELQRRADEWFEEYTRNKYIDKIRKSWEAYHGVYYDSDGHELSFGGEQGELVNLAINHYRNIGQHMLNMVTATRPSFQPRSVNTDAKSSIQTELAIGILDYYMREKRLERTLKRAVEYAIVLGSGYVKMEWNSSLGEVFDVIPSEEDPTKEYEIREGDLVFKNLSPYDVVFDSTKENYDDNEWVLCRTFKNKYAVAKKYPELAEQILNVRSKSDHYREQTSLYRYDKTDDIAVYEFFHLKNEAAPEGRYLLYLDEDIILQDTVMPYGNLPVYRISAADILGTPYGYANLWDLLPIQTSINSLYSTIMSNQSANGVQNIINPRGNDVRHTQIEGGMNWIDYNPIPNLQGGGKPEALQLTATPPEVFNFLQILERAMETVSGINSVARGNPESQLKSGTALALVQSQALQFMSTLQQNYIQMIEDVGTGMVKLLQDFATTPRIVTIVGVGNQHKVQSFKGDDISDITRVIVDVGNPLGMTTAGKVQMAEQMLQMKVIDTPEKYLEVMNTGKLTSMTQGTMDENSQIRLENEAMLTGQGVVKAAFSDKHSLHIREHKSVISTPEMRLKDPQLVERTYAHIMEHIELLRTTDPALLAIFGEQPLGPVEGTPPNADTMAAQQPPASSMGNMPIEPAQSSPKANLPQPATPPEAAPNGMPIDPKKKGNM